VKELSIVIDISGMNLGDDEKKMSPKELTSNVINHVMLSYSQLVKGLSKTERKQFYRIGELLDEAVKGTAETIQLDDSDAGFIRKCFREAKLTPNNILKKVEEKVDEIKDR
jgi:hypothetical protein